MTQRVARRAAPQTRIERATGSALGTEAAEDFVASDVTPSPREAFESVLREALRRPPCIMSFSGGRDSSALLAMAVSLAQREGLDQPIPVTLRFPGDAEAQEDEWQAHVLAHLGVRNHEIVTVTGDAFDVIGPTAQEVLARHGTLWPYNTYFHLPIVSAALGGSVVTGFGGDELAIASVGRWAERFVWQQRRGPRARASIALAHGPRAFRLARALCRQDTLVSATPWLTRRGRAAVWWSDAMDSARDPFGWSPILLERHWPSRWIQLTRHDTQVMADWFDVRVFHPFADHGVIWSLAAQGPFWGLGGRNDLMRSLFADVLPDALMTRQSKASFSESVWTQTSARFAREWSGRGLDDEYVDDNAIRRAWGDRTVSSFSGALLQQAWLAEQGLA